MKYFLDCGSNLGQGYDHFSSKYGDEYNYMLFEPNKKCYDKLVDKYGSLHNVKLYNDAVYIKDCIREFRYSSDFCVGGSIIEHHNSGLPDSTSVTSVSCVNLLKIIEDIVCGGNEVVIKFDIESCEYDVLEKMIESNLIFKVKKIYCEFHSKYMNGDNRKFFKSREDKILEFIKNNDICFELWR